MVKVSGVWAWLAWATMRAKGVTPAASASPAVVSTSAAAPSEIELELAAVMVPSALKAGFKVGIFSGLPRRGCSSSVIVTGPPRVSKVRGTISASKAPLPWAARARSRD